MKTVDSVKTVVIKWNPAISSFTMLGFLGMLWDANMGDPDCMNWSVWEHEKVHTGDILYWLKVGYGQTGIVGRGVITSEPYEDEDWSGKGRQTFYVDFEPSILINPDAIKLLDSETLDKAIPDFDWHGGHSGMVLSDSQADILNQLWRDYMAEHYDDFAKAKKRNNGSDLLFIQQTPTLKFKA